MKNQKMIKENKMMYKQPINKIETNFFFQISLSLDDIITPITSLSLSLMLANQPRKANKFYSESFLCKPTGIK